MGDQSDEDDISNLCWKCGDSPCEWVKWGEELKKQGDQYDSNTADLEQKKLKRSKVRKCLYRYYTYLKYGHLGKGVRIEVTPCVLDEIRRLYPEESNDDYMGFKES